MHQSQRRNLRPAPSVVPANPARSVATNRKLHCQSDPTFYATVPLHGKHY